MSSVALDRPPPVDVPERAPAAPTLQALTVLLQPGKEEKTTQKTQNTFLSLVRLIALIPLVTTEALYTKQYVYWEAQKEAFLHSTPSPENYAAWSNLLEE